MRYPAILIVLIISAGVLAQTNVLTMEQKMRKIIIPQIEFHQADAVEALSFLIQASTEPCPTNTPCIGLLQTNTPSIPVKTFTLQLEDGTPLAFPTLTLLCRRTSLLDAIGKVTEQLGLIFRFEHGQLVFFTKDGKRVISKASVKYRVPESEFVVTPSAKQKTTPTAK